MAFVTVLVFNEICWLGFFFIKLFIFPSISNSACPPSSMGTGSMLNIAKPMFSIAASIIIVRRDAHQVPVSIFLAVTLAPINVSGLFGVLSPFLRFWYACQLPLGISNGSFSVCMAVDPNVVRLS